MEDDNEFSHSYSYWSQFHDMFKAAREDLLKLDSKTKLKIIGQVIKNPKFDDVDLYNLTMFELQNSTSQAADNTNRACSVSVDREGSKNCFVAAYSVDDDDDDGERLSGEKFKKKPCLVFTLAKSEGQWSVKESFKRQPCLAFPLAIPKRKRSVREQIIRPRKRSSVSVPVDHAFEAEGSKAKAKKPITIRFKLKPIQSSDRLE